MNASRKAAELAPATLSEADGVRYLHLGTPWVQGAMRVKAPRTLELAWSHARALPASNVLMGAGAVALVVMLLGGMRRKSRFRLARGMA